MANLAIRRSIEQSTNTAGVDLHTRLHERMSDNCVVLFDHGADRPRKSDPACLAPTQNDVKCRTDFAQPRKG